MTEDRQNINTDRLLQSKTFRDTNKASKHKINLTGGILFYVQTLPGADIDSDHNLLVAKICTRLKKIISFQK
jgi:hypothetical protein